MEHTQTHPALTTPIIEMVKLSKWYGRVIGVNDITLTIGTGVTALLGPNGAGKSTLLQLCTGQLFPSAGSVTLFGQRAWNNPHLNRWIGLCPEQDAFHEFMSGFEFVFLCARLSGMSTTQAKAATTEVLQRVALTHAMHRPVRGYSKGMRQRVKFAQAIVHRPKLLFLDEPLTGTDPLARRDLMNLIVELAAAGVHIVVSSHILHEVEALTQQIILLHNGKLIAAGNIREIRDLMDTQPHQMMLISPAYRHWASVLCRFDDVVGVQILPAQAAVRVETLAPDAFFHRLPQLIQEENLPLAELYSEDDNLEALFKYLVELR